jgi:GNAT superfamily N-acetyltransferase
MIIEIQGPFLGKAPVCEPILRSLPLWFGIEASNRQYIRDINAMPTFIGVINDEASGFLTLKRHNKYSEEIDIMAVKPNMHRKGIGIALLSKAEEYLNQNGVEYLQVKTLSSKHADTNYASTRAFYLAAGFRPLEEFSNIWGEQSPTLLLVKRLESNQQNRLS